MSASQLVIPLLGIAALALVGAAPSALLTRLQPDVRAALVVPVGAAIVSCSSTFALLGVPVRWVGVALSVAGAAAVMIVRREVIALIHQLAVPSAVALVALVLASIPAVASGSWDAATPGNADPYYWVSEARAFLDGPAPAPAVRYPDRDMYELLTKRNGPSGLGFSLSLLSLISANAPENIYSAFAAIIDVVLALVVFVVARMGLRWTRIRSAAPAVLVAANAYLLFGTFYGWQAQLLLTSFGLLALAGTYAALEDGPARAFVVVGALGVAAGVCTYGPVFGPFIALGAIVIGAHLALHRDTDSLRRAARSLAAIGSVTLLLAAVPLGRSLLAAGGAVSLASTSSLWNGYQTGLPSEALGLVPRISASARFSAGWSLLSLAVALPLYLLGFAGACREFAKPILVWASGAALGAIVLLGMFGPNPYISMKIVGYVAPLLMLTVAAGRAVKVPAVLRLSRRTVLVLAGAVFVLSCAVIEVRASLLNLHARRMAGLATVSEQIPVDARVAIDVDDAWRQAWAIYYLRDHQLVIPHPQYFLSSTVSKAQESSRRPVQYVLGRRDLGPAIWRGAGLALTATYRTGGGAPRRR